MLFIVRYLDYLAVAPAAANGAGLLSVYVQYSAGPPVTAGLTATQTAERLSTGGMLPTARNDSRTVAERNREAPSGRERAMATPVTM